MRYRQYLPILVVILLIPILGFGLAKAYYWYQVRAAVEQVKQQMSLFAELEYGRIETGF